LEVTINVVYVAIAAAIVFAIVVYLTTRGNGKSKTKISFLKGLAIYEGEAEGSMANQVVADNSSEMPSDLALEVIKYIKEVVSPERVNGNYAITETTQDNWVVAARLYTKLDGNIIGTAFFEQPYYGESDLASGIRKGASFYRLSIRDVCTKESEESLNAVFRKIQCDANLVVLPEKTEISKIGGIFCKFPDSSHVAFIALNNYGNDSSNKGMIFSGVIAQQLYNYYKSFI